MEQAVRQPRPIKGVSLKDYLRMDEESAEKLEYDAGEVVAMAGTTSNHAAIAMNFGSEIRDRLRGKPCQAFGSDPRISVPNMPSFSYPDISVVYGPLERDPRDIGLRSVMNPFLLVEILSTSTERFDRGRKFKRYVNLASLQEYILVSQEEARIESYFRQTDGTWLFSFVDGLDAALVIGSLTLQIPLVEIYRNVVFPTPEEIEAADAAEAVREREL